MNKHRFSYHYGVRPFFSTISWIGGEGGLVYPILKRNDVRDDVKIQWDYSEAYFNHARAEDVIGGVENLDENLDEIERFFGDDGIVVDAEFVAEINIGDVIKPGDWEWDDLLYFRSNVRNVIVSGTLSLFRIKIVTAGNLISYLDKKKEDRAYPEIPGDLTPRKLYENGFYVTRGIAVMHDPYYCRDFENEKGFIMEGFPANQDIDEDYDPDPDPTLMPHEAAVCRFFETIDENDTERLKKFFKSCKTFGINFGYVWDIYNGNVGLDGNVGCYPGGDEPDYGPGEERFGIFD